MAVGAWRARRTIHGRTERRLAEADTFRVARRATDEDVTRLGEELVLLHEETLATPLDPAMREDYQHALDAYEGAKSRLADAATSADITAITRTLKDGRFAQACVLARRDGRPPPERRDPCFFDPAHGPATRDVAWAPPGGVEREIPVCFRDAERLEAGESPAVRLVRLGNRQVPWFSSGPLYAPWASGWYDDAVRAGRFEADRLTMLYAPLAGPALAGGGALGAVAWADPGGWSAGDTGGDWGLGGYDGGGFDGGGFDGGYDGGRRRRRAAADAVRRGAGGGPPRRRNRSATGRP